MLKGLVDFPCCMSTNNSYTVALASIHLRSVAAAFARLHWRRLPRAVSAGLAGRRSGEDNDDSSVPTQIVDVALPMTTLIGGPTTRARKLSLAETMSTFRL